MPMTEDEMMWYIKACGYPEDQSWDGSGGMGPGMSGGWQGMGGGRAWGSGMGGDRRSHGAGYEYEDDAPIGMGGNCSLACNMLEDCSSNGRCDPWGRGCWCYPGFTERDCSVQWCEKERDCSGHGQCDNGWLERSQEGAQARSKCTCDDFWTGEDCSEETPCLPGYSGTDCMACKEDQYGLSCTRECDMERDCNTNGRCNPYEPGTCLCFPGFTGPKCDSQWCDSDGESGCGGQGTCNNEWWEWGYGDRCICDEGWDGYDCTEEGGPCGDGFSGETCDVCQADLYAAECESMCVMEDHCSNNGRCNPFYSEDSQSERQPVCLYQPPYKKSYGTTRLCPVLRYAMMLPGASRASRSMTARTRY